MRDIDLIVVHCAATPPSMDIGAAEIREWHTTAPRNWSDIGYHRVIRRDGTVENGRPLERPGAHARGHNQNSIGICLVGGVDIDGKPDANFTCAQYEALMGIIGGILMQYPEARVVGHRDLDDSKACPCFDVQALWSEF